MLEKQQRVTGRCRGLFVCQDCGMARFPSHQEFATQTPQRLQRITQQCLRQQSGV